MSRRITLLCEDEQHAAFIRRFLKKRKGDAYLVHQSVGGGESHVRRNYPRLLDAVRKKSGILIVMIDADDKGVDGRLRQLAEACGADNTGPRGDNDPVAVFVPARNIETWFAYLDGENVDENKKYPRLPKERECARHVKKLAEMCEKNELPDNAPLSLKRACEEWKRVP